MKKVMKLILGMMIIGTVLFACKTNTDPNTDPHNHTYSEEWSSDETDHWHKCTGCTEIKDKTAHTWDDGEVTKNPTVAEAGTKTFTCTVCGKTRNEDVKAVLTEITVIPSKTYFKKNEVFDSKSLSVTANYTYGQTKALSASDYTITGFDSTNTGTKTVTVSFTDSGVIKTAEFNIIIYEQTEMTVEEFLTALGTEVEIITANEGVPGISKSEDKKTANVFGVKISGAFYQTGYSTFLSFPETIKQADLRGLDTSGVIAMMYMFHGCKNLISLNLSSFDTSKVEFMKGMFYGCSGLTSLDLSSFDTSNVTEMEGMFDGCSGLTSVDLGSFDTSNVTKMSNMFDGCSGLTSVDLSSFDMSHVVDMSNMFDGCSGLTSLDLSSFNTSSLCYMSFLFYGCSGLTSLKFGSNFKTSKVSNMADVFHGCSGLTTLDLSSFDTSKVTNKDNMFESCGNSEALTVKIDSSKWKLSTTASDFGGGDNLTFKDVSSSN